MHFTQKKPIEKDTSQAQPMTALSSYQSKPSTQVVLGTAPVDILDSQKYYHPRGVFLDLCS